ncbi:MAG: heavy metal translocating P-type ATPase, partial [Planctomycetota bacterium JB042]
MTPATDATAPRGARPARTTGADAACDHCGLPVPAGRLDPDAALLFCCAGCDTVHHAIRAAGLERYYDLRDDADGRVRPDGAGERRYAEFDDPAFREVHVVADASGRARLDLYLENVHCAACVWLVERLPLVVEGVIEARLDVRTGVARVEYDEGHVSPGGIARALDRLGYPCRPYRGLPMEEHRRREDRRHLIAIGISGACAGNAMVSAFALWGGALSPGHALLLRGLGLLFTLVALVGPGRVFFQGALSSLRTRTMHMDVPVALALAAGTLQGAWNTWRGAGETYFESITAVVFLLLVGRFVQHRQQRRAHDAVELLAAVTPATARLLRDGVEAEVPVEALARGDRVVVRAGDRVPADGRIVAGASRFDVSLLTGESRPVVAEAGDPIAAGAVNVAAAVRLEVDSTGEETRIGRVMELVERSARTRPPVVRLADHLAHGFVVAVLALALVTVLVWLRRDPANAVEHAIALLIVTCPCALGLATPLAIAAAVGRAARAGILVKGGEVLERLARPGVVLLDKTGTLTRGEVRMVSLDGDRDVLGDVAAVEAEGTHAIARAFVAAADDASIPRPEARDVEHVLGHGARGTVDGREIVVGSGPFVRAHAAADPRIDAAERRMIERGLSPVLVARDGAAVAVAGFGDPLRDDALAAVEALRSLGHEIAIVSGDHPQIVRADADELGVTRAEGSASPERKVAAVHEARARGA